MDWSQIVGEQLTSIGVGGMFALLIVREVLHFLKGRKDTENPNAAGLQSVEFWKSDHRESVEEAIKAYVMPILNRQTEILSELQRQSGRQIELALVQSGQIEELRRESAIIRGDVNRIEAPRRQ